MDDSEMLPAVVVPAGEMEVSPPSGVTVPTTYEELEEAIVTIAPQLPPVKAEEAKPPAPLRVEIKRRLQRLAEKEAPMLRKALGVIKKAQAWRGTQIAPFKTFRLVSTDAGGVVEAWGDPDVWISATLVMKHAGGLEKDMLPTGRIYDYLAKRKDGGVTLEVRCYADGAEELVIDGRLTLELVPPRPPEPKKPEKTSKEVVEKKYELPAPPPWTRPIEDLPKPLPELDDAKAVVCETTSLRPVMVAASTDETRINMNTVMFELCEHTAVATDGHRLHKMSVTELRTAEPPRHIDFPVMLPFLELVEAAATAYRDKKRLFAFYKEKMAVVCRVGEMTLRTRVADVTYPDWRQVVPKKSKYLVEVPKAKLLDALAGAQLVTQPTKGVRGVKLERVEQGLRVFCQDADKHVFDETIPVSGWQVGESVGLNVQYLLDALMPVEGNVALLGISDEASPVTVDGASKGSYLAVVMPMRL